VLRFRLTGNDGYKPVRRNDVTEPITIRHARSADEPRVRELAELDGRPAPQGETLLAEVDGQLWVAVGIEDGAAVADPFLPTGDVVWLLQMRAEQERAIRAPGSLVGRFTTVRRHAEATA
jgi:hypothetical protein